LPDKVIESRQFLEEYLSDVLLQSVEIYNLNKIIGGYSNHTYDLETNLGSLILRKPPAGNKIKTGHDVRREYIIIKALEHSKISVPGPVYFESNTEILGTPFYLMKKVDGIVLRSETLSILKPSETAFYELSCNAIKQLVALHTLPINSQTLGGLGHPIGYIERQVEGWIKRYGKAKTEAIMEMELMAQWISDNISYTHQSALIHNDFKYDNLILDKNDLGNIKSILDWEMATIGHPLMDLGTTLAYWIEENDDEALKIFNTTWLPGNMTRKEVVSYYGFLSKTEIPDMLFYLVFGLFKIAVIAQQIYHRYSIGQAKDSRFGMLIYVVRSAARKGVFYINKGKI
jgi:aminoglycoside phosphotransferase (APT) family kinase protein